jgi:hypothetical protein
MCYVYQPYMLPSISDRPGGHTILFKLLKSWQANFIPKLLNRMSHKSGAIGELCYLAKYEKM